MDPIRYTLSFTAPHAHYVEVRAEVPTSGRNEVELMMAVWTPGSYLIREYERHVENVAATGSGRAVSVTKTAKNRWAIATGGADTVVVTYRVYGREMSVRTNWIESGFALINGAPTFLTILGSRLAPGFMDWYLARTNVQGQQSRPHDPPSDDVNLWQPAPGDTGAHGEIVTVSPSRASPASSWASRRVVRRMYLP